MRTDQLKDDPLADLLAAKEAKAAPAEPEKVFHTPLNLTQVNLTSQVKIERPPSPKSSEFNLTSQVNLNGVKGDLRIPNSLVDVIFPLLETNELAVYFRLFRLSHGYHKETCLIGLDRLAVSCKSSISTIKRTVVELEKKGLIKREGVSLGGPRKGTMFRVWAPDSQFNLTQVNLTSQSTLNSQLKIASQSNLTPNKEEILKAKILKAWREISSAYVGASPEKKREGLKRRMGPEWDEEAAKEFFGGEE